MLIFLQRRSRDELLQLFPRLRCFKVHSWCGVKWIAYYHPFSSSWVSHIVGHFVYFNKVCWWQIRISISILINSTYISLWHWTMHLSVRYYFHVFNSLARILSISIIFQGMTIQRVTARSFQIKVKRPGYVMKNYRCFQDTLNTEVFESYMYC
jgi:hypothetical protein